MKQINLKADVAQGQQSSAGMKGSPMSLVLGILLLLISAGAYAGFYYYNMDLKAKTENYKSQKSEQIKKLSSKDYQELYAFQDRLSDLKSKLENRTVPTSVISKIAAYTLPEITYNDLTIGVSNGVSNVAANLSAGDFETMNRQIKAYTLIEGLSDYQPTSVRQDMQTGSYQASIKFSLTEKIAAEVTKVEAPE